MGKSTKVTIPFIPGTDYGSGFEDSCGYGSGSSSGNGNRQGNGYGMGNIFECVVLDDPLLIAMTRVEKR